MRDTETGIVVSLLFFFPLFIVYLFSVAPPSPFCSQRLLPPSLPFSLALFFFEFEIDNVFEQNKLEEIELNCLASTCLLALFSTISFPSPFFFSFLNKYQITSINQRVLPPHSRP